MDMRIESNDQFDFIQFLIAATTQNFLRAGDILIMDNAKIHKGKVILIILILAN